MSSIYSMDQEKDKGGEHQLSGKLNNFLKSNNLNIYTMHIIALQF